MSQGQMHRGPNQGQGQMRPNSPMFPDQRQINNQGQIQGQTQNQVQGHVQDQPIELNRHKMNPFSNQEKEFHQKNEDLSELVRGHRK